MERLLVAAALTAVAVVVALVLQRSRRPRSITAPGPHGAELPQALDRSDFASPETPWLVVVFSSATCATCAQVGQAVAGLASPDVGVVEVEWGTARDLHRRYRIDAVPAVAIADRDGNVLRWLLGPTPAPALREALHEAQHPRPAPEGRSVEVRGPSGPSRTEPGEPGD